MENQLLEIALRRRSVRSYKDTHIPDDVLDEILVVFTASNIKLTGVKSFRQAVTVLVTACRTYFERF
ncbi:MAG: hypothetical protein LIO70_09085, partial [Clostridiales bacterium]|nr:hypothetical protein [Clostridiales bacterium]